MERAKNYIFHPDEEIDLRFYHIGEEHCHPGYMFGPVVRRHYMLHYIISGKGKYYPGPGNDHSTRYIDVHAGQLFLIVPGVFHSYIADDKEPWHYIWLEFDGIKAQKLLAKAGLNSRSLLYTPKEYTLSTLSKLHNPLNTILTNPNGAMTFMLGNLYLFFDALIHQSSNIQTKSFSSNIKQNYLEQACNHIKENYASIDSIQSIANICNISQSYLNRIFKELMNMNAQEYLIEYRMSRASRLIGSTSLTITEIADMVGYSNRLSFTRAFKKKYNLTPTDFKNVNCTQ